MTAEPHRDEAAAWNVVRRMLDDDTADDADTRVVAARVLISGLGDADRFAKIEERLGAIERLNERQLDAMTRLAEFARELIERR